MTGGPKTAVLWWTIGALCLLLISEILFDGVSNPHGIDPMHTEDGWVR